MELIILCSLGLLIAAFLFFKIGDAFSPWMITTAIWFALLLMFQFQNDVLYPLSSQFYICLIIWIPVFCISSLTTYHVFPKIDNPISIKSSPLRINKRIFTFLYILSMTLTPLFLYQSLKIVTQFDSQDMLLNLRLLAVSGENSFGFLNYAYIVNQAVFVIAMWRYPKMPLWQLLTIVAANLISCFAIMEKNGIFIMITTTLFVCYEKEIIKLKSIVTTMVIAVVIFFFFNRSMQDADNDKAMTFIDFFAIYLLSSSVAFGRIGPELSTQFGSNCFQYFYMLLDKWGMGNYEVHSRLQEYVFVPLPTNVYTIFQPFYQDFQYKGIFFFAFAYGILYGIVYRAFKNNGMFARCLYAYLLEILIMQFYSEALLQNIVLVMQFAVFVYLMTETRFKVSFRNS